MSGEGYMGPANTHTGEAAEGGVVGGGGGGIPVVTHAHYTHYVDRLREADLESLSDRREKLFLNFTQKTFRNKDFSHWFTPATGTHNMAVRVRRLVEEPLARTERYRNSPLVSMFRLINRVGPGQD